MSDRREYMRTYKQKQREQAAKDGTCIVCVTEPARPNMSTCATCNDLAKDRVADLRERRREESEP